jgi:hypothetical protein
MQFKLVAKNTRSFAMPTQLLVWMLVAALDPSSMQSFFFWPTVRRTRLCMIALLKMVFFISKF